MYYFAQAQILLLNNKENWSDQTEIPVGFGNC